MVKRIIIIALLALFCKRANAQNIANGPGFTLEYPKGMDTVYVKGIYAVMTALDAPSDDFRENLNFIYMVDPSDTLGLLMYVNQNIDYLKTMDVKTNGPSEIKFGKNGLPAYSIEYSSDKLSPGNELHIWQAFVKFDNQFYIVTYTALPPSYNKYYNDMMKIISTIVFK